jgi:hypothetical protein
VFVVWGTRNTGKVDQRDGQYALTRFFHVYYVPLVPTSSVWVTSEGLGHDIKLSPRSVIAGYSRTWAIVLGVAAVLGWGGTTLFALALAAVALAAASWTWKDVSGERNVRRSDMNLLAFGTRCEPKLLPAPLAATLETELSERWAVLADGQSPGDVARFGTDDVDRAAAAYGVLRLKALSLPAPQAKQADADAQRIADGVRDKLQITDGGPYRSAAVDQRLSSIDPDPKK